MERAVTLTNIGVLKRHRLINGSCPSSATYRRHSGIEFTEKLWPPNPSPRRRPRTKGFNHTALTSRLLVPPPPYASRLSPPPILRTIRCSYRAAVTLPLRRPRRRRRSGRLRPLHPYPPSRHSREKKRRTSTPLSTPQRCTITKTHRHTPRRTRTRAPAGPSSASALLQPTAPPAQQRLRRASCRRTSQKRSWDQGRLDARVLVGRSRRSALKVAGTVRTCLAARMGCRMALPLPPLSLAKA